MKPKTIYLFTLLLLLNAAAYSQLSGIVFRDYNYNGTRQTTTAYTEPLEEGVIVNAYNISDVLIASYRTTKGTGYPYAVPNFFIPAIGSAYNGTMGSNTGVVPAGTKVRIEFLIPTAGSCTVNRSFDFSSRAGGTHVQFATGGATNILYAINDPSDYVADNSPFSTIFFYGSVMVTGNPLGAGNAATQRAYVKTPYNVGNNITYGVANILATNRQIGTTYGSAYSKYARRIFVSAYLRRHAGYGPANGNFNNAPGAIYIINPALNSATIPAAASYFTSLDALGYPTHNTTGIPAYGYGTSFTTTVTGSGVTRVETINYINGGETVIGSNTTRNLPDNVTVFSNDPAAFGQIGKIGLGDMEISDDGQYLFVTNLYDRKIYQLRLNSISNPTAVTVVNSWSLPSPPLRSASGITGAAATYSGVNDNTDFYTGSKGLQRPFGLKYYKGKLYIGSVTTAEGPAGISLTDDNTGNPEYTDMWAYVWELTSSGSFTSTPVIQFPLNFYRGLDGDGVDETWNPWTNTFAAPTGTTSVGGEGGFPQPMLSGIEFDIDGSLILAFRDRAGDQGGTDQGMITGNGPMELRSVYCNGDQIRAFKNPATCLYEVEKNAKEGTASLKPATTGANNAQGPGNGEFYYQDGIEMFNGSANGGTKYHFNTGLGSVVLLPGTNHCVGTYMDPGRLWSNGISWMNNTTGANTRDCDTQTGSTIGKSNGLGDLELIGNPAPIEIGNRVWYDADFDGIQDADENGIAAVEIELLNNAGTVIATATTDANGTYYFTSAAGTNTANTIYNLTLLPNTNYTVRVKGTLDSPFSMTGNPGLLATPYFTFANISGNGQADWSDNDGIPVGGVGGSYQVSVTTNGYGENNHSIDFGFTNFRVLPMKWIYFTAAVQNDAVKLEWKVEAQDNVKEYVVESGTDGTTFYEIFRVSLAAENIYRALDEFVPNGIKYYRIRAIGNDGSTSYSNIQKFSPRGEISDLHVYPNPAKDIVKLRLSPGMVNKPVEISILTIDGKLIMVQKTAYAEKEEMLNVSGLPAGKYIIRVDFEKGFNSKTINVIH